MPQGEETFLYRIVTQLDDEEAFSQVSQELSMIGDATEQAEGKMQNLLSEIRKMSKSDLSRVQEQLQQLKGPTDISGLKNMKGDLEALEKNLEDGTEASKRLNKVIEGVESADFKVLSDNINDLKKNLSGTSTTFSRIENQLEEIGAADNISEARQRFQRLKKMVLENEEVVRRLKNEGNFDAMAQRVSRLNDVFEDTKNTVAMAGGGIEKKLGQSLDGVNTQVDKTRLKTNQMSQAILQGAQDAQFGVIGVANNIQMLGESISRQMSKGVSGTRLLKSTLSNLFMGPMAIGTLITTLTLLAQNWDSVKSAGVGALQSIGFEVKAQNDSLQKLADSVRELDKDFGKIGGEEFIGFFEDIGGENNLLQKTEQELNKVRKQLAPFRSQVTELKNTLSPKYSDAVLKTQEYLGMWNNAQIRALELTDMKEGKLQDLIDREEVLSKALEAANAESMKELKLRRQLERIYGLSEKQARKLADSFLEISENTDKASKSQESFLDLLKDYVDTTDKLKRDFRLVNGEIESFAAFTQEAVIGTDASFDENLVGDYFQEQAEEAKKARKEAKKLQERYEKMLGDLSVEAEENQFSKKFQQIQLNISRRREEIRQMEIQNTKKERLLRLLRKIERQRRESAVENQQVEGAGLQGSDKIMLPNGQMVNPDTFVEDQRKKMKRVQKRLDRKREQLNAERNLGDPSGGLLPSFGLGQMFSISMMNKEEDLRLKRLRSRLKTQQKRSEAAMAQGDEEEFAKAISKVAELQKKIKQTEDKWQEKRRQQQIAHFKKMAENIESSPLGNAVSDLTLTLGGIWKTFFKNKEKWSKKSNTDQAKIIMQAGSQVVGAADTIATATFESWKEERAQDLKEEGKTAEERRKILREEGKKRFKTMKALRITEASINTAAGVTRAFADLPTYAAIPAAAAIAAKGLFRINQIAGMSIGDKLGGGGGGGQSVEQGSFTQMNADRSAGRANSVINNAQRRGEKRQRETAGRMEAAANKFDRASKRLTQDGVEAKIDDKTSEQVTKRGTQRINDLNK